MRIDVHFHTQTLQLCVSPSTPALSSRPKSRKAAHTQATIPAVVLEMTCRDAALMPPRRAACFTSGERRALGDLQSQLVADLIIQRFLHREPSWPM